VLRDTGAEDRLGAGGVVPTVDGHEVQGWATLTVVGNTRPTDLLGEHVDLATAGNRHGPEHLLRRDQVGGAAFILVAPATPVARWCFRDAHPCLHRSQEIPIGQFTHGCARGWDDVWSGR